MTKNMYTVAGDGPCNEELALRIQAGDKNAAERLVSQNEGYLTDLARAYTPWCEMEDLKQEAALALLDAARRFDPAYGTKLLTYATPAMGAALSDYAAQYSSSLSIPISRYNQLRRVAYLCAEAQDASETELTKAVCEKLRVSSKAAEVLLKEYHALCGARQLGDDVFSISCDGDPAVAYDCLMRRTLLMQRMEEVLTPRELNLVRSYLGIGQPDEVGLSSSSRCSSFIFCKNANIRSRFNCERLGILIPPAQGQVYAPFPCGFHLLSPETTHASCLMSDPVYRYFHLGHHC